MDCVAFGQQLRQFVKAEMGTDLAIGASLVCTVLPPLQPRSSNGTCITGLPTARKTPSRTCCLQCGHLPVGALTIFTALGVGGFHQCLRSICGCPHLKDEVLGSQGTLHGQVACPKPHAPLKSVQCSQGL